MSNIKTVTPDVAYKTYNAKTIGKAYGEEYADTLASYNAVSSLGYPSGYSRTFINIDPSTSVKSEYGRGDYNYFRPSETVPERIEDIIYWGMRAYDKIGIVHNVIDLMGDFTCQGIRFVHANRKVQKFHDELAKKWKLKHVSERFANTLYRCGSVVIHGLEGEVPLTEKNKWSAAANDISLPKENVTKYVIPLQYVIYHPLSLDVLNPYGSQFNIKPVFALKLADSFRTGMNKIMNDDERAQYYKSQMPGFILDAIKTNSKRVVLDPEKVSAFYYKKDDWEIWAKPIITPILDDLMRLEKLNLADISALDGAISTVRHWKVGSLEYKIIPNNAAVNKLKEVLANSVTGGTREIVTGPEIDFKESNTNVHQFLGSEKYVATLNAIYAGLGIPPTLTGVSTASGFTNNYISIKTLVERLEYGRDKLVEFWTTQLEKVAKAMGFSSPAKVVFDNMILSDESAEKALLLQLVDRDLISVETIRAKFDLDDEIERLRIDREYKERQTNKEGPQKASPYHDPEKSHEINKILLGGGDVTPSEVGVNLQPRKPGEKSRMDKQQELKQKKYDPANPNGRPKNAKDSDKRKQKTVKPRTSANLMVWAQSAYKTTADIVTELYLDFRNKKNVRSLSAVETQELETLKFDIFANLTPFEEINSNLVYNLLDKKSNNDIKAIFNQLISDYSENISQEQIRQVQIAAYISSKISD